MWFLHSASSLSSGSTLSKRPFFTISVGVEFLKALWNSCLCRIPGVVPYCCYLLMMQLSEDVFIKRLQPAVCIFYTSHSMDMWNQQCHRFCCIINDFETQHTTIPLWDHPIQNWQAILDEGNFKWKQSLYFAWCYSIAAGFTLFG